MLEREAELGAIDGLLAGALAGRGGLLLLSGQPGVGKTTLLEAAARRADAIGVRTLMARASLLERDYPFGVAHQLLSGPLREEADRGFVLAAARRAAALIEPGDAGAPIEDSHAVVHALYGFVAELAERAPLLMGVDDLQWADEASLRVLTYIGRRIADLPVAIVGAARDGDDPRRLDPLAEAWHRAGGRRHEPRPLSQVAVAEVLAAALGEVPTPRFASACSERTGGNPFLVAELAGALRAGGIRPTDHRVDAVRAARPEGVGDSVRHRLGPLGGPARALAEAVAVLGDGSELPVAAALAGLTPEAATRAAEDLAGAAILDDAHPLRFRHPLVRTAVEAGIPAIRRGAQHARAARILDARGAPAGRVAAHLLASPPGAGDPWAVDRLRAAARTARAQGSPEGAVAWLRRAADEPPATGERAALLRELGAAAVAALIPEAAGHLREAAALSEDPRERAGLALELAISLYYAGAHTEAVDVLIAAIDEADGDGLREERLRLEAFLGLAGRYDLRTQGRVRGRVRRIAAGVAGVTPAERLVRSVALLESPGTARELAEAARLAEEVDDELPWPDPAHGAGTVAMHVFAGRPERAAALAERMLAAARADGSPMRHAIALASRGMCFLDVGEVAAAIVDLEAAVEAIDELGASALEPTAGYLVLALAESGDHRRADRVLAQHALAGRLPERMLLNPVLFARGVVRSAQRRWPEAVDDLLELGRRHEGWGMTRPTPPWRSQAALALLGGGDAGRARALAEEELALARGWGAPKPIAIAERALALVEGGEAAIARLEAAAEHLDETPWRLERARVRCDLGAALRRAGRRREARAVLSLAMDEAHACGASAISDRAAQELRASGARPRRRAMTGVDALTPAERRVVELAAAGRTNRDIALELFVTLATVETHLGRSYRKLGIEGRAGLAAALADG